KQRRNVLFGETEACEPAIFELAETAFRAQPQVALLVFANRSYGARRQAVLLGEDFGSTVPQSREAGFCGDPKRALPVFVQRIDAKEARTSGKRVIRRLIILEPVQAGPIAMPDRSLLIPEIETQVNSAILSVEVCFEPARFPPCDSMSGCNQGIS